MAIVECRQRHVNNMHPVWDDYRRFDGYYVGEWIVPLARRDKSPRHAARLQAAGNKTEDGSKSKRSKAHATFASIRKPR